ncbi:MAG: hypothetical protein ACJAWL_001793 [Motiliproteus sp.]|jgi:hypothetical protein
MKAIKLIIMISLSTFLFGCASGAKMQNMTYLETQKNYDKSLQNEVGVSYVSGGEETNPAWSSEISNSEFSGALKVSLSEQGLLSNSGKYSLKVNMEKVDQPLFGLDMTVTTHVNYVLTDTNNNTIILDKTVIAPYTATIGDAFAAIKRLRLANEGSGKKNIEGLLEELSKLNIEPKEISLTN